MLKNKLEEILNEENFGNKTCLFCGRKFIYPLNLKKVHKIYCSKDCQQAAQLARIRKKEVKK